SIPGGGGVYCSGRPSAIGPQLASGSTARAPAAPSRARRVTGTAVREGRAGGITGGFSHRGPWWRHGPGAPTILGGPLRGSPRSITDTHSGRRRAGHERTRG